MIASMLLLASIPVVGQYAIEYRVNGLPDSKAYLLEVHGNSFTAIDSSEVNQGKIFFKINDERKAGVYRIAYADSLYIDVIFNKESVILQTQQLLAEEGPEVLQSEENKVYFAYWKYSRRINDTINLIASTGDVMYEASGHVLTPALDSMQRKANALNKKLQFYADSLVQHSGSLLAAKIIRAYQTPDYYAYLKSPGAYPYRSRLEFLRDHFFDNLDLNDERLIQTEVVYMTLTDYLQIFGDPPTTANFNRAIDTIMQVFTVNEAMKEYALMLLINSFEHTQWEKVFLHLIQNYVSVNSCGIDGADYIEKAEIIKNLQAGNIAPDIEMKDVSGKLQKLSEVRSKVSMVLFWGSDCPHCQEVLPGLLALYERYHPLGFQIYAVSVDTDPQIWKSYLNQHAYPWINVCDFKGVDSGVFVNYNTWFTPGFFMLDADKRILSRPYLLNQIETQLKEMLN